jgi:hypothetical protein
MSLDIKWQWDGSHLLSISNSQAVTKNKMIDEKLIWNEPLYQRIAIAPTFPKKRGK